MTFQAPKDVSTHIWAFLLVFPQNSKPSDLLVLVLIKILLIDVIDWHHDLLIGSSPKRLLCWYSPSFHMYICVIWFIYFLFYTKNLLLFTKHHIQHTMISIDNHNIVVRLWFISILLFAQHVIITVKAACPNSCHARGRCTNENVCVCEPGFTAPDCSQSKFSFSLLLQYYHQYSSLPLLPLLSSFSLL